MAGRWPPGLKSFCWYPFSVKPTILHSYGFVEYPRIFKCLILLKIVLVLTRVLDTTVEIWQFTNMTEQEILNSLGLPGAVLDIIPPRKVNRLDLSACLKDRYHHKLSFQAIADKYGVSKQAVQDRLSGFVEKLGDPEELRAFQDIEADILSAIKRRYSSKLLAVDLDKTSPKDLAMVYGITYDKHRLQTGQSTSNQSVFFQIVADSDTADTTKCGIEGEVIEADTSDQA